MQDPVDRTIPGVKSVQMFVCIRYCLTVQVNERISTSSIQARSTVIPARHMPAPLYTKLIGFLLSLRRNSWPVRVLEWADTSSFVFVVLTLRPGTIDIVGLIFISPGSFFPTDNFFHFHSVGGVPRLWISLGHAYMCFDLVTSKAFLIHDGI